MNANNNRKKNSHSASISPTNCEAEERDSDREIISGAKRFLFSIYFKYGDWLRFQHHHTQLCCCFLILPKNVNFWNYRSKCKHAALFQCLLCDEVRYCYFWCGWSKKKVRIWLNMFDEWKSYWKPLKLNMRESEEFEIQEDKKYATK